MGLTAGFLGIARRHNEAAMQDEAEWISRAGAVTVNTDGEPVVNWATAPVARSAPCGFNPTEGSKEQYQDLTGQRAMSVEIIVTDATMRLGQWAQAIGPQDRMRLVRRYGTTLQVPLLFDVVGYPEVGPTGVVLNLRKVEA